MRYLLVLVVCLSGCVPLGVDKDLTVVANHEWQRVSPPKFARRLRWEAHRCIGPLPMAMSNKDRGVWEIYIPVGWHGALARGALRYEMSKVSYMLRSPSVLSLLAQLDAVFHLPPSELHSWYWVMFPDEAPEPPAFHIVPNRGGQ